MTEITFTKMHGCGNDFVVLDCMDSQPADMAGIARILCQRRFGVGADQLLTIKPSDSADFRMEIYNADGGEVEMCGNGIRCFAKYVYEHGLTRKREMEVDTLAGIMRPRLKGDDVEVDMGQPVLDGRDIPVDADGIVVGCGDGALRITRLQKEGAKPLAAAEFLIGTPLPVGTQLG